MIVYLAQAQRLASEGDGYAMALRTVPYPEILHSFHYTDGLTFPIHAKPSKEKPDVDLLSAKPQSELPR